MINSFDTEIALDVGMAAAVLYRNISYWCEKNRTNGVHKHDGLFWTYNSVKAYKQQFPYMSERTIRTALASLEEKGYIKIGHFNEDGRDRTKWFADIFFINNTDVSEVKGCICQNDKMQIAEMTNASADLIKPLPNNYTNISTNNNKKERKKEVASPRAKEPTFDEILDSVPVIKENPELRKAFFEFIKMRKLIKAPLTNRALELAINDAFKYGKGQADQMQAVVEQSVKRSWRGIFEIKPEGSPEPVKNYQDYANPYTELRKKLENGGEL